MRLPEYQIKFVQDRNLSEEHWVVIKDGLEIEEFATKEEAEKYIEQQEKK